MNNIEISEENGFTLVNFYNGISSLVFKKDEHIYKINKRNSVARAQNDYDEYRSIFNEFPEKLQESHIFTCTYLGEEYTCIKQRALAGQTLKKLGHDGLISHLKTNSRDVEFFIKIISEFLARVENRKLYPDPVGNPDDQSLANSINIILEPERGLVMCDVGLSPHEDTLQKHGLGFYDSDNVRNYKSKMEEALKLLSSLN